MGMDVYGYSGNYFRSTGWSWRVICCVIKAAHFELPDDWHYNEGSGLRNKKECLRLAEMMEEYLIAWPGDEMIVETEGIRVDEDGKTVDPNAPGSRSPYSASREHLENFVQFLRECGEGFEIW